MGREERKGAREQGRKLNIEIAYDSVIALEENTQ